MVNNDALPAIEVDPETFAITIDGELHRARAGRTTPSGPALLDVLTWPSIPSSLLMLLADARLPVAGHTQSGGLEPALRLGVRPDEVPAYIATRLSTIVRVEAATAVVARPLPPPWPPAWRTSRRPGQPHAEPGDAANVAHPGSRPAASCRPAVARLTRQSPLWRLCLRSPGRWPSLPSRTPLRLCSPCRWRAWSATTTYRPLRSAALKLLPLDPAEVVGWVLRALPAVAALADEVGAPDSPRPDPGQRGPQIEAWAEAHAVTTGGCSVPENPSSTPDACGSASAVRSAPARAR